MPVHIDFGRKIYLRVFVPLWLSIAIAFFGSEHLHAQKNALSVDTSALNQQLDQLQKDIFKDAAQARKDLLELNPVVDKHTDLRFRWHNVYGIYCATQGMVDFAKYHFNFVLQHPESSTRGKAGASHNLLHVHRQSKEFEAALKYATLADSLFGLVKDTMSRALVKGSVAAVYKEREMYDLSVEYLLEFIAILESSGNVPDEKLVNEKQKLGNTYLMLNNYSMPPRLYEEVLMVFKVNKNLLYCGFTLLKFVNCLYDLGRFQDAENTLKKALAIFEDFNNSKYKSLARMHQGRLKDLQNKNKETELSYENTLAWTNKGNGTYLEQIYMYFIRCLVSIEQLARAKRLLDALEEKGILENARWTVKSKHLVYCAVIFGKLSFLAPSLEVWKQAILLKDSLASHNTNKVAFELQEKYAKELLLQDKLLLKKQNSELENRIRIQRLNIIIAIAFILLLIFFISQLRLRSKNNDLVLENLQKEKALQENENLIIQERVRMQNEQIALQKQQLLGSMLEMARRNQEMNHMMDSEVIRQNEGIMNVMRQLRSDKKTYGEALEKFNKLHPGFRAALGSRFPLLSKDNLDFCSLIKMNISPLQIADLLSIDEQQLLLIQRDVMSKTQVQGIDIFYKTIQRVDV